jgi:PTS system nitrogen regulatory IIA component
MRLTTPVPFDAPDGKPVNLVFVLLVPERATDLHLQILSELAQLFSDRAMRDDLLRAESAEAAHRLIVEWEPNAPGHRSSAV